MTPQQALSFIHSTPNFARQPGLHRIRALMHRLGDPQKQLAFVHIGGTNGKGSTAAMVSRVLESAGYSTGLFTSPYLQDFRERIRLNGQLIPPEELAATTRQVKAAAESLAQQGMESPNEFELVTAIALCWYARKQAEVVVLEVGLGGRYDATNVIDSPVACAITSISLDHTAVLGNTVEEIAGEKVGILKTGSVCVLAPGQQNGVTEIVQAAGLAVGCPVRVTHREDIQILDRGRGGMVFRWQGMTCTLPLLGQYQADNLCTALGLISVLRQRGFAVDDRALQKGLSQVEWPGRLELLREGRVLLDCCHNPDGIAALCHELDTTFSGTEITAVMGMLGDKDYHRGLLQVARRSVTFYAVSPPSPRALSPEEIARVAAQGCKNVVCCTGIRQALACALANNRKGLVVVCGSIPLVGEARTLLEQV